MLRKTLIIFAHPRLEASKVNKALLETVYAAEDVTVRDLYELYPDFNIDVQAEQIELLQHDTIIWHHPFYWYSCPPLLKHWIDQVLEYNWAYGPTGKFLAGKQIFNLLTAGGTRQAYCASGNNIYTIAEFLRPFEQTALLCGMKYLPPFAVFGTYKISSEDISDHQGSLANLLGLLRKDELATDDLRECQFLNDLKAINHVIQ